MLDISSAKVKKVIVHRVGNKLRDEGIYISPTECHRSISLDDSLLKSFLAPVIRRGEEYQLLHESDILLNTINHYASCIFTDNKNFGSSSDSIAKHLYSCSGHPNIGGGEFLVILFDDIRSEDRPLQALGLFRVEGRDEYLDFDEDEGTIQVTERSGISLARIQKGAIVLSTGLRVFAVDTLGQKTKYWIDNFLKATPINTPQKSAHIAGALVKAISRKVESPSVALEFSNEVEGLLAETESFSLAELKKASKKFIAEDEIDELLAGAQIKYGVLLDNDVRIESKRFAKHAKDVVTKARIAEGVSLVVSNPDAKISSIEVNSTKRGFRAVIDVQMKEE